MFSFSLKTSFLCMSCFTICFIFFRCLNTFDMFYFPLVVISFGRGPPQLPPGPAVSAPGPRPCALQGLEDIFLLFATAATTTTTTNSNHDNNNTNISILLLMSTIVTIVYYYYYYYYSYYCYYSEVSKTPQPRRLCNNYCSDKLIRSHQEPKK